MAQYFNYSDMEICPYDKPHVIQKRRMVYYIIERY